MPVIYTAQYRYSGPGRLDISMKGQDPIGKVFAPSKAIVYGYLYKGMSKEQYTAEYRRLMSISWQQYNGIWQQVWAMPEVTFVCFCRAGEFCHRLILKDMFVEVGAEDGGERKL